MDNRIIRLFAAVAVYTSAVAAPSMAREALEDVVEPRERVELRPEDADDGGKRAIMLGFTVQPQSFSMSHNVQFDEQGQIQHENSSAQLQFTIKFGGDVKPVSYEAVEVTKLTDERGNALPLPNRPNNVQPINDNDNNRRFGVSVSLPQLPASIEGIGLLEGRMKVQCGIGEQRHARLGKATDIDGRRIRVDGLDEKVSFVLRRDKQNKRIRLEASRDAGAYIAGINFTDAAGNVIPSRGGGYSYNGEQVTRYFYIEWPDEGTATASFYTAIDTVHVPITVRDLQLRKPMEHRDQSELVVKAVTADQLRSIRPAADEPVGDAAPAPDAEVRIRIEDH